MLFVSCLSLVSPLGYSAAATAAALRAKIAAFGETAYRDGNGEPIVGAMVECLVPTVQGRTRLIELLRLAIDELAPDVAERLPWNQMPLILCSREAQRPGARVGGIVGGLRFPDAARFVGTRAVHLARGAPSAFMALAIARSYLARADVPVCLILGIDSLIDARVLDWLDRTHRLKTSDRTDGIIPGEAACMLAVSKAPLTDDCVALLGVGEAMETATILNDDPFRADGMTAAVRDALREAGLAMHDVDVRLSDVAGESYAFEEIVLAQTRLMRKVRPRQVLWHPADCMGDCGAVAGLIQLAWAGQAYHRRYAPGPVAALHTASPFGDRAAAVVAAPDWKPV